MSWVHAGWNPVGDLCKNHLRPERGASFRSNRWGCWRSNPPRSEQFAPFAEISVGIQRGNHNWSCRLIAKPFLPIKKEIAMHSLSVKIPISIDQNWFNVSFTAATNHSVESNLIAGLHLSRVWMSFVCRIGHMKTGSETKLSARVCLMVLTAILALVCSGCQSFMTDKEHRAAMAREAAQNHETFIRLKPGLLATWRP